MSWTLTDRLDEFDAAAGPFLRAQAARNTVLLSIMAELAASGSLAYGDAAPFFGWWASGPEVTAACLRTPPHALLITGLDQPAAAALAACLPGGPSGATDRDRAAAAPGPYLPGVTGRVDEAAVFAAAWLASSGQRPRVRLRTRLYRLEGLVPPEPWPDGAVRRAGPADTELVTAWYQAFATEAGDGEVSRVVIDGKLRDGRLVLWDLPDGGPVAMAGMNRPAAGVARVGPVYTLPDRRGRGYGSAATAAITLAALDAGASEVVLFTDLSNPVSNSIYQRLGYRPVEDQVSLAFPG